MEGSHFWFKYIFLIQVFRGWIRSEKLLMNSLNFLEFGQYKFFLWNFWDHLLVSVKKICYFRYFMKIFKNIDFLHVWSDLYAYAERAYVSGTDA